MDSLEIMVYLEDQHDLYQVTFEKTEGDTQFFSALDEQGERCEVQVEPATDEAYIYARYPHVVETWSLLETVTVLSYDEYLMTRNGAIV
jgi:hypothetical protein